MAAFLFEMQNRRIIVNDMLKEKLVQLGFNILEEKINNSRLFLLGDNSSEITIEFTESEQIDKLIHRSHNGNEIQSIGVFRFVLPRVGKEPEFFIFSFSNSVGSKIEFIIIPSAVLLKRLRMKFALADNQEIEIVFWLMPDSCLYETTQIGAEFEWYYMSKGINGRMADGTDWDYTEFLNHWSLLIKA
jgi:hypothetical protein